MQHLSRKSQNQISIAFKSQETIFTELSHRQSSSSLAIDALPVRHRVPTPVEYEAHKVGPLELEQRAHLLQVLHLHRMLEHLEDLEKGGENSKQLMYRDRYCEVHVKEHITGHT